MSVIYKTYVLQGFVNIFGGSDILVKQMLHWDENPSKKSIVFPFKFHHVVPLVIKLQIKQTLFDEVGILISE